MPDCSFQSTWDVQTDEERSLCSYHEEPSPRCSSSLLHSGSCRCSCNSKRESQRRRLYWTSALTTLLTENAMPFFFRAFGKSFCSITAGWKPHCVWWPDEDEQLHNTPPWNEKILQPFMLLRGLRALFVQGQACSLFQLLLFLVKYFFKWDERSWKSGSILRYLKQPEKQSRVWCSNDATAVFLIVIMWKYSEMH